eukprot:Em0006g575a
MDPLSRLAACVAQKLEEGDFRGAVRIASSDDKVAPFCEATITELQKKHPPAHQDTVIPPLNPALFPSIAATEIIDAIRSFPCGSAGGPDGLTPQHLKDMTHPSANAGAQLLVTALASILSLILEGKVPHPVRPFLFGASLTALEKKSKLTANKALLKLDFTNAFNTVRRDKMLASVELLAPSIFPFIHSVYSAPSSLFWDDRVIHSCEELSMSYLDDISLGGDVEDISNDLVMFKQGAKDVGLQLNPNKFPGSRIVNLSMATLLGSPLGDVPGISSVLTEKTNLLKIMAPCFLSLQLQQYDAVLKTIMCNITSPMIILRGLKLFFWKLLPYGPTAVTNLLQKIAVSLRLGLAFCKPHSCHHCGCEVTAFATHGLSCVKSQGRYRRHSSLNDIIHRAFGASRIPSRLEPSGISRSDAELHHRRQGQWLTKLRNGNSTNMDPNMYLFAPVVIETSGVFGKQTLLFLKDLACRFCKVSGEVKSLPYLLQCLAVAVQREILVHPTSQTICQGENTTLVCQVRGIGGWRVNGTTITPNNQASFRSRGFTATVNETGGGDENEIYTTLAMTVEGRVQNNNTKFICYSVTVNGEVSTSKEAFLVIAGYPLPPSPTLLITNSTNIQVSWKRPFAMREVADILYYTVRMYNSSSQGSKEWTIRSLTLTDMYTHNITVKEVANECILLSFEVRAVNKVGNSSAGITTGGFPIETLYSLIVKTVPGGEVVHSRTSFLSRLNQNQSTTVVLDGLKSNVSYQFSFLVGSVTGEVMFSTMATNTAAGDIIDDSSSPIGCISVLTESLLTVFCTPSDALKLISYNCSMDGSSFQPCYTPIRLAEYSNKSHILLVQGYSEQGELSVTSLNFTGTLGSQEVKFTNGSPILVGRNLTVFVEASKSYDSVMCEVHMLTAEVSRQDCSSGAADFNNLPEGEAVIRLAAKIEGDEVASIKSRLWVYDDPEFCAPYLVNDMISVEGEAVRVTFGSSGKPSGYSCSLNSTKPFLCSSPVSLTGLRKGKYVLHVRPEQCNSYQTSSFSFEI